MASYKQGIKVYQKWIKEGRGSGVGEAYKPWLNVYNVPSRGLSHRVWSCKSSRVVHCLSDLELSVFLLLNWCDNVIDIREQFPLCPKKTSAIAIDLGFKHPAIRGEKVVMSSDFVVTHECTPKPYSAFQVKPSSELSKQRVREILAIEEAYWKGEGIPFEVVTEKDVNVTQVRNIKWLMPYISKQLVSWNELTTIALWKELLNDYPRQRLIDLSKIIDDISGIDAGSALAEMRIILANKVARFDMRIPFFDLLAEDISFHNTILVPAEGS